jgi:hypothetical protein
MPYSEFIALDDALQAGDKPAPKSVDTLYTAAEDCGGQ